MSEGFISQIINSKNVLDFTIIYLGIRCSAWTESFYLTAPSGRYVFIHDTYYNTSSWEGGFKNVTAKKYYNFGDAKYAKNLTAGEFLSAYEEESWLGFVSDMVSRASVVDIGNSNGYPTAILPGGSQYAVSDEASQWVLYGRNAFSVPYAFYYEDTSKCPFQY